MIIPISLLENPRLTDCDIRVLLTLDLMGWREGHRDGVIRASNQEIANRSGKKLTAVRDSIRRLKAFAPPVIECDMLTANTRTAIKLAYDRYGKVVGFPTTDVVYPTTPCRKSDNLVVVYPTTPPIESKEIDQDAEEGLEVVGFPTTSASDISSTPKTPAEVIAWLPCIGVEREDVDRLRKKVPAWVQRIKERFPQHADAAVDWVLDALISACDKEDVVAYAEGTLKGFAKQGGRKDVELAPRPVAQPDETDPPISRPSPNGPTSFPARSTKAQRNAEANAARRASVARLFAPKESADEPR